MGDTATTTRQHRWAGGRTLATGHHLYWWVEVAVVAAVYLVYSTISSAAAGGAPEAYANAIRIVDAQQWLRLNHELAWQQWALNSEPFIVVSNYFYGAAYVVATLGTLVYLYRRFPDSYPLWRNTLAVATMVALIGFAAFPVMPPRLLDAHDAIGSWGFVDTMVSYPALWSFESEAMNAISNQFAAMPSLHCAWALWVCAALWPHLRSRWSQAAAVAYPVATVVVVVITGNHYFLDAVGGAAVMAVGYSVALGVTRAGRIPRTRPQPVTV